MAALCLCTARRACVRLDAWHPYTSTAEQGNRLDRRRAVEPKTASTPRPTSREPASTSTSTSSPPARSSRRRRAARLDLLDEQTSTDREAGNAAASGDRRRARRGRPGARRAGNRRRSRRRAGRAAAARFSRPSPPDATAPAAAAVEQLAAGDGPPASTSTTRTTNDSREPRDGNREGTASGRRLLAAAERLFDVNICQQSRRPAAVDLLDLVLDASPPRRRVSDHETRRATAAAPSFGP